MTRTKYQQLQPEERMRIEIWKAENVSQREMAAQAGTRAFNADARASSQRDSMRWLWGNDSASPPRATPPGQSSRPQTRCRQCAVGRGAPLPRPKVVTPGNLRYSQARLFLTTASATCPTRPSTTPFAPTRVSIHVRPPEVNDRLMPGHWEGDLIKGAGNRAAVGVLVERMSRAVLLVKMSDATATSALAAFTAKLQSLVAPLRQSLTYDQGREMARHAELSAATGVRVYFCDPHSPWQRGSCENTNGLLSQYLPKGTDLSVYS